MTIEEANAEIERLRERNAEMAASCKRAQDNEVALSSRLILTDKRVKALEETFRDLISYLGHVDQDVDHGWMVKRMRAALASPSEPAGGRKE